jgi:uncharacterized membrane protein YkoI
LSRRFLLSARSQARLRDASLRWAAHPNPSEGAPHAQEGHGRRRRGRRGGAWRRRRRLGGRSDGASRLDDGKDLLPQATITEHQAISVAQTAASGALNEVDLEHLDGRLVFNVDVGDADVKVDAETGEVVRVDHDD